ncbi:MAG: DUF4846 domain-containing protein, partial [Bacteroidota bacterium]
FVRETAPANSFAAYLQNLPLKPAGAPVLLFNGEKKARQDVHAAVIDLDVGEENLQQCADAVMRLRAEHLFQQGRFEEIHFNFTNGFRADYTKWRQGWRILVTGNRSEWQRTAQPSNSYEAFREYLKLVFTYAGTLSLSKEMKQVAVENLQVGDVFIQGGSPGHAVIVVDVAAHPASGKKVFLLAQSYMPAQEMHVLKNQSEPALNPWYELDFGETLNTPEWSFSRKDLKRF